MRTKFNFTVIPANAKSSKDALAALRLLKGLYEGTATIKGEKKSFPKQDISDIDMEDLTNKIALWTDICTLEKKLIFSCAVGANIHTHLYAKLEAEEHNSSLLMGCKGITLYACGYIGMENERWRF